jgi:hypothetical protein
VEAGGVGGAAESKDEDLVDGVADGGVHLPLLPQRRQQH